MGKDKKEKPKKREVDDKGVCSVCKEKIRLTEDFTACKCGEFKR